MSLIQGFDVTSQRISTKPKTKLFSSTTRETRKGSSDGSQDSYFKGQTRLISTKRQRRMVLRIEFDQYTPPYSEFFPTYELNTVIWHLCLHRRSSFYVQLGKRIFIFFFTENNLSHPSLYRVKNFLSKEHDTLLSSSHNLSPTPTIDHTRIL